MKKVKSFAVLVIIFMVFTGTSSGFNLKLIKKINLPQNEILLEKPLTFCVTEDTLFLIPDYNAGDIKIYDSQGKLVKIMGRKGFGPDELARPSFCFYNKVDHKFGVMDFGARKIFIYDRTGPFSFNRAKEVYCLGGVFGFQLKGNLLVISGYKPGPNQEPYDLYSIDLTNDQPSFLLPSYQKYGLNSLHEYETQYRKKNGIKALGIKGWLDVIDGDVFFIWEGDLRIIKINAITGKLSIFGKKTSHYIKPSPTKKLLESFQSGDFKTARSEWDKMSYIKNIFVNPHYVLVVYNEPVISEESSNFWVQFYTLTGEFITEVPITGKPDSIMCFDKDREILYSLGSEPDEKLNEEYWILEYKIEK